MKDILHELHCADYLKRSFSHSGAQFWNNLPRELTQATSLTGSGTKLSRHSFTYFFFLKASMERSFFGEIFIVTVVKEDIYSVCYWTAGRSV